MLSLLAATFAALRIVSLAPSITEDLFAIGAGPQVVAVDAYSNRPAAARRLPRIGSLREVNGEAILALHPDLVVGITYQAPALTGLARAGVRVEALEVENLAEELAAIERLGALTGHVREATTLRASIDRELRALAQRAAHLPERSAFVVVGQEPLYSAGPGSFIDDLLKLAHLHNVAADTKTPWPAYSAERLVAEQPDIIVVPRPSAPLRGAPWEALRAVRAGRIVAIAEDTLLHPGPGVADALRELLARTDRWR
jgi:iron complex transport system substrate-binding protein